MTRSGFTDSNVLLRYNYATPTPLETRLHFWRQYGTNPQTLTEWLTDIIQEFAPNLFRNPARFLDAGCGTGSGTIALALALIKGTIVYGVDLSEGMVEHCRQRTLPTGLDITFCTGDVQCLPFPSSSFDLVTAIHVLHHVPDFTGAISDLHRVATAGGCVLVTTFAPENSHGLNALHRRAITELGLPDFLLDDVTYSRFAPCTAEEAFRRCFGSVEHRIYDNSARCSHADAVLDYYRSAVKYRHSAGPDDQRVSRSQWEALDAWVARAVAEQISLNDFFVIPGAVHAFFGHKEGR